MRNRAIIFWIIVLISYFVTRVVLLFHFPLFTDEVYYQRLMSEGLKSGNWLFSFADGKEPFYFWIMAIFSGFLSLGVYGARIISVLSGLGSLICIYFLSSHLFSRKVGIISVIIYLLSPFALIYNQLGIIDGFLSFLLCLAFLLIIKKRIFFAAFIFGLCLITKTISQIYFFLFITGVVIFNPTDKLKKLLSFFIVGGGIYLLTSFLPGFGNIASKNATFVSFPSLFEFINNSKMAIKDWLVVYVGFCNVILVGLMAVNGFLKKDIKILFLSLLIIFPLFVESFIAKIFFPRYLLFILCPIIILQARFLELILAKTSRKILVKILIFILILQPVISFVQLEVNPENANMPEIERWQFFEGWPSGYHIEQVFKALDSGDKKFIYAPNYGIGEFVRWKYLSNTNYQIVTFGEQSPKIGKDAFLVSNELVPGLSLVKEFCRYECKTKVYLYESDNKIY